MPRLRRAALAAALLATPALAFPISDPLAADPAALRITLTLPPGIAILPGSATLNVTVTEAVSAEAAASTDALALVPGPALTLALATPAASEFAGVEAKVAAWRAARRVPAAQIAVAFTPCRSTPDASVEGPLAIAIAPAAGAPQLNLLPAGTTLSAWLGPSASLATCPD